MMRAEGHGKRTRRAGLALVGWGAIARRVAQLLTDRKLVDLVAVAVRDTSAPRQGLPAQTLLLSEPGQLADLGVDLVIEAADRSSVAPWGASAFAAGCDFAVCSTSAFTDDRLLAELLSLAERSGRQLILPPGALAGIDGLAAASVIGLDKVEHSVIKPPAAWRGTAAEQMVDLGRLSAPVAFFEGSAREAASRFPKNANAAVVTSLAGVGLEKTRVVLVADPDTTRNAHRIRAWGAFGHLDAYIENEPLVTNNMSSEMTALGLVRLVENRVSLLVR